MSFLGMALFLAFVCPVMTIQQPKYPTVLLHGVLANSKNMDVLKDMIETTLDVRVYNVEIGNGAITSIFTDLNYQLELLCNEIYKIKELEKGFNFIGMSQGGLLARGYVEYCNKYPVNNLITLVSPNGGIYYNTTLANNMYDTERQSTLSISNYWRDPYRYDLYLSNSTYLAQLNQEVLSNCIQNNLDVVQNFVMVWSPFDEVIIPLESAKFSLQKLDSDGNLISQELTDTDLFKSGNLNLKMMYNEGRIAIFPTDCTHSQHREPECFPQLKPIFERYLL